MMRRGLALGFLISISAWAGATRTPPSPSLPIAPTQHPSSESRRCFNVMTLIQRELESYYSQRAAPHYSLTNLTVSEGNSFRSELAQRAFMADAWNGDPNYTLPAGSCINTLDCPEMRYRFEENQVRACSRVECTNFSIVSCTDNSITLDDPESGARSTMIRDGEGRYRSIESSMHRFDSRQSYADAQFAEEQCHQHFNEVHGVTREVVITFGSASAPPPPMRASMTRLLTQYPDLTLQDFVRNRCVQNRGQDRRTDGRRNKTVRAWHHDADSDSIPAKATGAD